MRSRHMQIIVLVKQSLHSHLVKKIIAIVMFMFVYVVLLVKAERTYGKHNIRDLSEILNVNSSGPTQLLLHSKKKHEAAQEVQHS